jgi:D-3-phosphoglycerate dehydrogenase
MKIGFPDDYVDVVRTLDCFPRLKGHDVEVWNDDMRDSDELVRRFQDLDALVLLRERTPLKAEVIRRLPKLKLISMNGPHPNVDVPACTANGTLVCVGHGRISYATAELTWGLVLSAARSIPQQMARLQAGGWQSQVGRVLRGGTLGIVGFGKIGRNVAEYGRAFGMRVLVWSRERGLAEAAESGFEPCPDKAKLFEMSDVVSLHVRYLPATHGLVTASDLARMKPSAIVVNTSRSGLIEDGALENALRSGKIGGAAIDVYDVEPVQGAKDPLLHFPNVVCTPHLGYVEFEQLNAYYDNQIDRILAFAAGKPVDIENPDALKVRSPT